MGGIIGENPDNLRVYFNAKDRKLGDELCKKLEEFVEKHMPKFLNRTAKAYHNYKQHLQHLNFTDTILEVERAFNSGAEAILIHGTGHDIAAVLTDDQYSTGKGKLRSLSYNASATNLLSICYRESNWRACTVSDSLPYNVLVSELKKTPCLLMEDANRETVRVLIREEITKYGEIGVPLVDLRERFTREYVEHEFPKSVARWACELMRQYIIKDSRVLDMVTGPGSMGITLAVYARDILFGGEEIIRVIGGDSEAHKEFIKAFNIARKKANLKHVSLVAKGRENLVDYLTDKDHKFSLITWHFIVPTAGTLIQASQVLAKNGVVAVTMYDSKTLKIVYDIISSAFFEVTGLYIPIPQEEILELQELTQRVVKGLQGNAFEVVGKHFSYFPADFKDSDAFLRFIYTARPYIVRCFYVADRDGYHDAVWARAKTMIEKRFGKTNIKVHFGVNFVLCQKDFQPFATSTSMDRHD